MMIAIIERIAKTAIKADRQTLIIPRGVIKITITIFGK